MMQKKATNITQWTVSSKKLLYYRTDEPLKRKNQWTQKKIKKFLEKSESQPAKKLN